MSSFFRVMTSRRLWFYSGCGAAGFVGVGMWLSVRHESNKIPEYTEYKFSEPAARARAVQRLRREHFDVIVVGGGAVGSGVALEAAQRGLNCALVERDDFASGTSSRSTKLIHGGVRYLESAFKHLDFGELALVWEALEERSHMMQCAKYMTRPMALVMPIWETWQIPYFYSGIRAYDLMSKLVSFNFNNIFSSTCLLPSCFYVSAQNAKVLFPLLPIERLKGALVYYDGVHNDSRMNVNIALTASIDSWVPGMRGAACVNHCEVTELLKNPEDGTLVGLKVVDSVAKDSFEVKGHVIINCSGPLTDTVRVLADPNCQRLLRPSSGVHIILPPTYSADPFGLIIPRTTDGRVLYFIPWEGFTLTGTTDSPCEAVQSEPVVKKEDVEFIVKEVSQCLGIPPQIISQDILAVWSGLRPLVANPRKVNSSEISRKHQVVVDGSGLISIVGGKWTTYRKMAQDGLHRALAANSDKIRAPFRCRTKFLELIGSRDHTGRFQNETFESLPRTLANMFKIPFLSAQHLVRNYGFRAIDICELGKREDLLDPLCYRFIRAEILFAVRHELACTVPDVIGRRLRLGFLDCAAALSTVDDVLDIMQKELKWTTKERTKQKRDAHHFLEKQMMTSENEQ